MSDYCSSRDFRIVNIRGDLVKIPVWAGSEIVIALREAAFEAERASISKIDSSGSEEEVQSEHNF